MKFQICKEYPFPLWWKLMHVISIALGFSFILFNPEWFSLIKYLNSKLDSKNISLVIGIFLISIPSTHLIIYFILNELRKLFKLKYIPGIPNLYPPAIIGMCESIIYPATFFIKKPEFIGIWLAVKVASQWTRWGKAEVNKLKQNDTSSKDDIDESRRRYMHFLIGNALSIIAGATVYAAIKIVINL